MSGTTTALTIHTPEGVTFEIPLASPFSRCLALCIDLAVIAAILFLVLKIINLLSQILSFLPFVGKTLSDFGSGTLIMIQFAVVIGYGMATEWFWSGQTLGKRLLRLRVIDEGGLPLDWKQVVIRNLFRLIDMMPSTLYLLGGLSSILTSRCQRLGDLAAGTLVVRETEPQVPDLEQISLGNRRALAPHISARIQQRITAEEARLLLDSVMRRDALTPAARLRLFGELAHYFRGIVELPDEDSLGLSDEQYIRDLASTLLRRSSAS